MSNTENKIPTRIRLICNGCKSECHRVVYGARGPYCVHCARSEGERIQAEPTWTWNPVVLI